MAPRQGPLRVPGRGWRSGQGSDQHRCAACRLQTPGQGAPGGLTPLGPRAPPRPAPTAAGPGEGGPPELCFLFWAWVRDRMRMAEVTDPGGLVVLPLGLGQGQDENGRADGPRWAGRPPPGASGPSPGREDGQVCAWSSRHGPNLLWGSSGAGLSFRNATRALSRGCDLRSGALPRPRDGVLRAREEG